MNITTFRAFHSRNYRLYFSGQSASLIGTWMQRTAVYWIVYIQTHSVFMVGVAVFAIQFPSFLLSLVGGAVADRYNRYRVLLITQVASMIQAVLMTLLVFLARYTVTEILALSIILGIINAFDVPARQSLVYYMVDDPNDLSNAIALNSTMANLARLIGPALSGIVLEYLGAGLCFALNAASFLAVITSLLMMRLPEHMPLGQTKKVLQGMKEGFRYLVSTPAIGRTVILMALSSLLVLPYVTLFPVIAKMTLHGNAATYGYLNSFTGLGALTGAIFLASMTDRIDRGKVLVIASLSVGTGLILFSRVHVLWLALPLATVAGFGMMSQVTLINTLLQTSASTEMRGRVISYFAMAFFGMQPIGALLTGSISHYAGTSPTILLQGLAALVIAGMFYFVFRRSKVRDPLTVNRQP